MSEEFVPMDIDACCDNVVMTDDIYGPGDGRVCVRYCQSCGHVYVVWTSDKAGTFEWKRRQRIDKPLSSKRLISKSLDSFAPVSG